jgi:hypothetical protein
VDDSDTALLLADSPRGHRWSALLTALVDGAPAVATAIDVVVAWAAEAGQTATAEAVAEVLSAAERDNRAAHQAWRTAGDDAAAMTEIVRRNQISFIEVYVLRVLDVLGLAVPVQKGTFWAYLAGQAHSPSP